MSLACRCGKMVLLGRAVAEPCVGCEECGTVPSSVGRHIPVREHTWRVVEIDSDDGPETIARCIWCDTRKPAESWEKAEAP